MLHSDILYNKEKHMSDMCLDELMDIVVREHEHVELLGCESNEQLFLQLQTQSELHSAALDDLQAPVVNSHVITT